MNLKNAAKVVRAFLLLRDEIDQGDLTDGQKRRITEARLLLFDALGMPSQAEIKEFMDIMSEPEKGG
jgi:hypothetical protein